MNATDGPAGITLMWAEASNKVIGLDGDMPWHVPEDLRHFQQVTTGATVLMGRRTWESLPARVRPLRGRSNVVLSRDAQFRDALLAEHPTVRVFSGLGEAQEAVADERVVVIGGAGLFQAGLEFASVLELTRLDVSPDGDTFAPSVDESLWECVPGVYEDEWQVSVSGVRYRFERWLRRTG